jgi:hypothetical protein
MIVGGVAATAAARSWPFRIFSFPSEIKPGNYSVDSGGVYTFAGGKWGKSPIEVATITIRDLNIMVEKAWKNYGVVPDTWHVLEADKPIIELLRSPKLFPPLKLSAKLFH